MLVSQLQSLQSGRTVVSVAVTLFLLLLLDFSSCGTTATDRWLSCAACVLPSLWCLTIRPQKILKSPDCLDGMVALIFIAQTVAWRSASLIFGETSTGLSMGLKGVLSKGWLLVLMVDRWTFLLGNTVDFLCAVAPSVLASFFSAPSREEGTSGDSTGPVGVSLQSYMVSQILCWALTSYLHSLKETAILSLEQVVEKRKAQAEDALVVRVQEAEGREEAFCAYTMHEIRTPLNVGHLLLDEMSAKTTQAIEFVERITQSRSTNKADNAEATNGEVGEDAENLVDAEALAKNQASLQKLQRMMKREMCNISKVCKDATLFDNLTKGRVQVVETRGCILAWARETLSIAERAVKTSEGEKTKQESQGSEAEAYQAAFFNLTSFPASLEDSSEKEKEKETELITETAPSPTQQQQLTFRGGLFIDPEILPEASDDSTQISLDVIADFGRLTKAVEHLAANAGKFSGATGGCVSVDIRVEGSTPNDRASLQASSCSSDKEDTEEGMWLQLTVVVKDEGIGIEKDRLASLFTPFAIRTGASMEGGGAGLGLCISKAAVEAHRCGSVTAQSEGEAKGSTFTICAMLPRMDRLPVPTTTMKGETGVPLLLAAPLSSHCSRDCTTPGYEADPEVLLASPVREAMSESEKREEDDSLCELSVGVCEYSSDPFFLSSSDDHVLSETGGEGHGGLMSTPVNVNVLSSNRAEADRRRRGRGKRRCSNGSDDTRSTICSSASPDRLYSLRSSIDLPSYYADFSNAPKGQDPIQASTSLHASEPLPSMREGVVSEDGPCPFPPEKASQPPAEETQGSDCISHAANEEASSSSSSSDVKEKGAPPLQYTADVLVVDDQLMCRLAVAMVLRRMGLSVEGASNGTEAVRLFEEGHRFRLVFMDKNMPVMEGPQATALIRSTLRGERGRGSATRETLGFSKSESAESINHSFSAAETEFKTDDLQTSGDGVIPEQATEKLISRPVWSTGGLRPISFTPAAKCPQTVAVVESVPPSASPQPIPSDALPAIIGLTADISEKSRNEFLSAGADKVLHKPATAEILVETLSALGIGINAPDGCARGESKSQCDSQSLFRETTIGLLTQLHTE
uniref:histidine kinase n=1 Tax=Chromera velia CCMP2878 TaxID=1169474 RepID=A0A0G4F8D3_9ALVE|eukprot:Cvel_15541.t1-p1 / transcript=Cvel_15541.t1 / gene=Cvel_15541 / organism=Chromera_velia_CCMP2878 / gene_product=hypothetical protein / transcript_product=hypothetical protein / location=Cvel_scaffold1154:37854-42741(+) / protein_length=1090 / sequence_SO=supercontig / SO=protein_coding / is_pseudo=false